jgi:uncharacterized protein YjbI with pentapeptide repeats
LDLHGLDLKGCSFADAHLQGVNFERSDIQNLDLSSCNLVNANLHNVKYNKSTQFPGGYPIPSDAVEVKRNREDDEPRQQRVELESAQIPVFVFVGVFVFVLLGSFFILLANSQK